MSSVHEIVRKAEHNYIYGVVKHGKYINWSMYDTLQRIDAYLNSVHTTGDTDALGREKPFFNIVTAATNIWYRSTDIDRKNIRILPSKSESTFIADIATIHLQRWMDKNRFGVFLNQWGRALARYGSAIVKFVEQDGELIPSVISWNRFIADPTDFDAIPRIEKFYKTPEQLRKMKNYDKNAVDQLINAVNTRKNLNKEQVDNQADFIELYEVHGELPEYFLEDDPQAPDNSSDIKYRQQMHVISFVESNVKGEYDDFCLYKGKEKKDPYLLTHLIEEDGRTLGIGAVEYLFDAQWMQNHSIKQWKDQIDLASKLIFQTSDSNFIGRNVLTAIETGDIMITAPNKPLTMLNNAGHDISSIQAFTQAWQMNGQQLTSTPDALRGITPVSGTPYSTTSLLSQNANSLFEIMTENKGLAVEDMLRNFVIDFLKRGLDTTDEIMASISDQGIQQIDTHYIKNQAIKLVNKKIIDRLLNEGEPTTPDQQSIMTGLTENSIKQSLDTTGNNRFFKPSDINNKTWQDIFSDFEWENLVVEVTNENKDKAAVVQTLSTIFQVLAQTDPARAKLVYDKLLTETGVVSPIELSQLPAPSPLQPQTSTGVGGGGQGLLFNNQSNG